MNKKQISKIILLVICAGSFLLLFPTVDNNIDNPNMLVYFNTDEGWLMDLAWSFYSGERRASFQGDFDVGIGLLYLADLARFVLSRFMTITPTVLVLFLRWLYLFAWLGSFIALWRLVSFHFGKTWQPALAVMLLAARPAVAYFSTNLKAEPLILCFMLIGLDYTLRIVEQASPRRNVYLAIACAALAFLIKYSGLFLLPAIIAALYLFDSYRVDSKDKKYIFAEVKASWLLPLFIGLIMLTLPLATLLFYVRKSTGWTWYEQFGLWGSIIQNRPVLYLSALGLLLIFLSLTIRALSSSNTPWLKKIIAWVNKLNSYSIVVCGIFLGFTLLFGLRWVISPNYFITTYAQLGSAFLDTRSMLMVAEKGLGYSFLYNIITKIKALDVFIVALFVFYLIMEIYIRYRNLKYNPLNSFKRRVLLIFLAPLLILALSMGRIEQHHMLPFFVVLSILSIQGLHLFITSAPFNNNRLFKRAVLVLISILFIVDIAINAIETVKLRIYQFHQSEDIAFDIGRWWQENIPPDTKIAADHYIRVYIPAGYRNLKTLNWNGQERALGLRRLVDDYQPELIYYNAAWDAAISEAMPAIEEILPGKKTKLVKSFKNSSKRYQRKPNAEFVIYRIFY